jgi:hypothetical protein
MTRSRHCGVRRLSALLALAAAYALAEPRAARAQTDESSPAPAEHESWFDAEPLSIHPHEFDDAAGPSDSQFLDPESAKFDKWQPLVEETSSTSAEDPELRPFDWMRHWGFRHSSTDGRFIDKSIPLEYSSWLNRPYHVDWFLGPLLTDDLVADSVTQSNELFGGLRVGWDFDYYWGVEWRLGWADPQIFAEEAADGLSGSYFVSDVDFVYYPWGDTKVRPYFQLGLGMTQVDALDESGFGRDVTLLSMPLGAGVQFPQTRWLAWRLEVIDNLAFGADGVDTMNNFAFTAGMELRLGARPHSYWPWRSSRKVW